MKELQRWLCHKYDVNYMIMQKQYDNDGACHNKRNSGKFHGNRSRNVYGNAIIGRYGDCFEEDIRRLMCDRAYHITGLDAPAKFAPTIKVRKGNARYRRG